MSHFEALSRPTIEAGIREIVRIRVLNSGLNQQANAARALVLFGNARRVL
jgi:hypothetical protein